VFQGQLHSKEHQTEFEGGGDQDGGADGDELNL
jgi:hypothetical protein